MKNILSLFVFLILTISICVYASPIDYGVGALNVLPAWTTAKGNLKAGFHSRAFFKDEVTQQPGGQSSGTTFWDIQGNIGIVYGFTSKLELGLSQVFYQDTHKGNNGYNFPDDLYLSAKLGSLGAQKGPLRMGVKLDIKIPTGNYHNLALEPYSADRIGLGLTGLLSIVSEPLFPSSGIAINANLGIFNHNDIGLRLTENEQDTITSNVDTKEIIYGLSFSKRMQEFGFFMELYGRNFIDEPPITAFTRENSLFVAPGISYTPNPALSLRASFDIRILGNDDKTVYGTENGSFLNKPWQSVPNLPSWRINVGLAYSLIRTETSLSPTLSQKKASRAAVGSAPIEDKFYDELVKEKQETESAEQELNRIREERERMEDILKRLRQILEYPGGAEEKEPEENNKEPK